MQPKSSARVLTSLENLRALEEKERKKMEEQKLKEERRRERERKCQEKRKMVIVVVTFDSHSLVYQGTWTSTETR